MRVYALYCRNKWVLGIVMFEVVAGLFLACVSGPLKNRDTSISFYFFCSSFSLDYCLKIPAAQQWRRDSEPPLLVFSGPSLRSMGVDCSTIDLIRAHCKHAFHQVVKVFSVLMPLLSAQQVAMAFSGLLVLDFTVFVLTIARSIRLWKRSEPFLHHLFIDGAFAIS
jgi:hypothetical protein